MMHSFSAMNTSFHTFGLSEQGQREAESWFAFVEKNLSRFLQDSELSRLNRSAGRPFLATPLLFQAVSQAVYYYTYTEGLFHPFLGQALEQRGYSRSFEHLGAGADKKAAGSPAASPELELEAGEAHQAQAVNRGGKQGERTTGLPLLDIQLNAALRSILIPAGWSADLGGIAKGWSAEQFADMQKRKGVSKGVIDAGGDIMLWGSWDIPQRVAVADPFHPAGDLLALHISERTGIATSSRLKRSWTDADGKLQHHITDPRTLTSGSTDLVQVTVLHPSLAAAEAAAKCLLLLGSEEGTLWMRRHFPLADFIIVREDGQLLTGGELEKYEPEGLLHVQE
ncbi:FAD:protein FMN transferase [Paenibacillus pinistramenti]|uniref:FAD:protein FMN transferase n=1 Tax=Paenibacillus pinistramenti TaxID=1768003 RepID=UPI001108BCD2|nr:FAD:protein FMN transferase [Paenibacillus pinistramenti]